ncbi:proteasome-activating nucleotidase, putative [Babesia ovis]|uniref:Proteasome-activating nucleotidase, putative n=1 Tax=Babesia ovis TaxID=5869 RepID=A0A9W5TBT2_BABOV|nr:proteasome-activating nucleotidase, putative [Babesia ovis]
MDNIEISSSGRHIALILEQSDSLRNRDDHEAVDPLSSQRLWYRWRPRYLLEEGNNRGATEQKGITVLGATNVGADVVNLVSPEFDPIFTCIAHHLQHASESWYLSALEGLNDEEFQKAGYNIIGIIRDTIMTRLLNILLKMPYDIPCGFWIPCMDSCTTWDFCEDLCRNAFWLTGSISGNDPDRRIYTIDVSKVPLYSAGQGIGYGIYGHIRCCCRVCRDISSLLSRDDAWKGDPFPASRWLYNIIETRYADVLTFLDHNKQDGNIEHQLLLITVDAYLCHRRMSALMESSEYVTVPGQYLDLNHRMSDLSVTTTGLRTLQPTQTAPSKNTAAAQPGKTAKDSRNATRLILDDGCDYPTMDSFVDHCLSNCGCFVFLRGVKQLMAHNDDSSDISIPAVVIDLLSDYCTLWSSYQLPVHMFCCHDIKGDPNSTEHDVFYDMAAPTTDNSAENHLLSKLSYFRYRVDLTNPAGGPDILRERYLRQKLNLGNDEHSEATIMDILSMTSSYDRVCLPTLVHIAACEYVASLKDQGLPTCTDESELFRDIDLTIRCFEMAVSIRQPISLSIGIPNITVVPYNSIRKVGIFANFPPLQPSLNGTVQECRGLDSVILSEPLKDDLTTFVSHCLSPPPGSTGQSPFMVIQGPSGYGKTHLSIALAHELHATLLIVNITSFLRSEVSMSERLVHQFFASLEHQFPFTISNRDSLGDPPRCVVVLENTESLSEDTPCMRSLLYGFCTELSRFHDQWVWNMTRKVLFVFTCEELDRLPARIREICSFDASFILDRLSFGETEVRRCFELYLRHRGPLLDRFQELWPSWSRDNMVSSLRPCDVVNICRTAVMWYASGVPSIDTSDSTCSAMSASLCASTT